MKSVRPTHAVVSLPSLDVRREPDHRAELASQLILGEIVRVISAGRRGLWWRVENQTDGYRGWVRAWGLVGASAARAARWRRLARAEVIALTTFVQAGPGRGPGVSPLVWRSRVIPGTRRGAHLAVELPDGRRGWARASDFSLGRARRKELLGRVQSLLGVPYLWGGRSSAALDCSAFVQLVLAEQGLSLPRDAHTQYRCCRTLRRGEEPVEGDLAFFSAPRERMGHVAIGLGGGYFAHSRGRVQISSLDPGNPLCDKALANQFRGWFRLGRRAKVAFRTSRKT